MTMLGVSLLTLLTPTAAEMGFGSLIALRVIIGFLHGVSFPAMHAAWSKWAPVHERSRLVSYHITGASMGTMLIFPLAGSLAHFFGWKSIFYATGTLSLLWCLFWHILIHDSPSLHPSISSAEQELIEMGNEKENSPCDVEKAKSTPWKAILCSLPVWGVTVAHVSSNWGNYQLNSMMPTYLHDVLGYFCNKSKSSN